MFKRLPDKLPLPTLEEEVLDYWKNHQIFEQTLDRGDAPHFTFYEGPPTANGKPGIHHVFSRTIKDLVCRYKTMRGYQVHRKAGWDTHGLPVEIEVERRLGIKHKEEIEEYGVDRFNAECRKSVFEYKDIWEELTHRMGYWVDMDRPYITCENDYIESVWWALDSFFKKDLIYQGFKVQLYCPRCGTPLSSHEVSLGYRDVNDPSVYIKARLKEEKDTFFLVWTTTPWTLVSNVALAVGPDIDYVKVRVEDEYLILAKDRLSVLGEDAQVVESFKGSTLAGKEYDRWFDSYPVEEKAWYVIEADFVTTTDGSGIVHLAPAYGEDDYQATRAHDLPMIQAVGQDGEFSPQAGPFAGMFFKEADPAITRDLKLRGLLHSKETCHHSYPHCWRCDTPLLFYARKSWYIRTTDFAPQMIEQNRTIDWHPPEVGAGRFGNWLEENKDWAISRNRYWGTPIPIWVCPSCEAQRSVGSVAELREQGHDLPEPLDLHKPFIDGVTLDCTCGGVMRRIPEVVDVWFDSGSMPFAQWHYPFENEDVFRHAFPADFIAEGVDQTRGWFYTLHAISCHLFGQPSFKNVIVNDMILDRKGQKMSKSRGNTVDPFEIINQYGADAVRWFLVSSSPPWKPKIFDPEAISEIQRKLFNTVLNTYSFFALYANIDGFGNGENDREDEIAVPMEARSDIDRWITSLLHSTATEYVEAMDSYDPTRATRLVTHFVVEELSNWYVRRNRRRFWKGELSTDKIAAYQTLSECLLGVIKMMAPIAPFLSDELYRCLVKGQRVEDHPSVHIAPMIEPRKECIDADLERRMKIAQQVVFLVRSMRSRSGIKGRQPLARISIPVSDSLRTLVAQSRDIILEEINVKEIEFVDENSPLIEKTATPNFRQLGPRFGKQVNHVAARIRQMTQAEIAAFEQDGRFETELDGSPVVLESEDLSTATKNIEGWIVESADGLTVALDTTLTDNLVDEGCAREFVNRVQNMRKDAGFEVTDRIRVGFKAEDRLKEAIQNMSDYVKLETLALEVEPAPLESAQVSEHEIEGHKCEIGIVRVST
jgi:isoleucyl-tRNA synthetase